MNDLRNLAHAAGWIFFWLHLTVVVTQINRKQLVVLIIIVKSQLFPLSLCGGLSLGKAITDQNVLAGWVGLFIVDQFAELIFSVVINLLIGLALCFIMGNQ